MRRVFMFGALVGALIANPANAGLFSTTLADKDAKELKHVAVVSQLGHKLEGQQVGLTVFGNQHFDADIPEWTLDADVRKQAIEEITASGRLTGVVESWDDAPEGLPKQIVAAARDKGFDAVLIIAKTSNPNDRLLPEGPSLLHKNALGLNRVHPCNSLWVAVYRVADGERLAAVFPDACDYRTSLPPAQAWHESWADYSDADKQLVVGGVSELTHKLVHIALTKFNLGSR